MEVQREAPGRHSEGVFRLRILANENISVDESNGSATVHDS